MLLFISILFTVCSIATDSAGKDIESTILLAASGIVLAMHFKKP